MKRLIFLIALLLPAFAFAQEGILTRDDCGDLTPVTLKTECLQLTNASGRIAGRTYIHNGTVWVEKSAITVVNSQTGTTYTILNSDSRKLVTFSNASAVAVTLPQAGASSEFLTGWFADFQNRGTGTATITPTTSTIDGAVTLALTQNQGVRIFSDGANYFTQRGVGSATGGVSGAPDSAQYVVGAAHGSLSAERVATDTTTIDVDMGTAGQARFNVQASSIGTSHVIQTQNYNFTGLLTTPIAIGSLPAAATPGRLRWVNDAASGESCQVAGGGVLVLCYDNGDEWLPLVSVSAAGTDDLDDIIARGNSTDGCTQADPCEWGNAVIKIKVVCDDTNVCSITTTVPADSETIIQDGQKWCLRYLGDGTCIETIDPTQSTPNAKYQYASGYRTYGTADFSSLHLLGDGTNCPENPSAVQIGGGPRLFTFMCGSGGDGILEGFTTLPKSWDGGPVLFQIKAIQTAADTNAFAGDVKMQCKGPGEAPGGTWGTSVAVDKTNMTGSNGEDHIDAATAVTPAGTCVGGDTLYVHFTLDVTGTTVAEATLNLLGYNVRFLRSSRSD